MHSASGSADHRSWPVDSLRLSTARTMSSTGSSSGAPSEVGGQAPGEQVAIDRAEVPTAPISSTPQEPQSSAACTYLNCFAGDEQELQAEFRNWRDRIAAPLVQVCLSLGATADRVSGLSLAMLIPFGLCLWRLDLAWTGPAAVLALTLHVLLDGLDGPLARARHTDGPSGAFTDLCLDHTGYLIVTTLLATLGWLPGGVACAYAATYTLAVVMIVSLNLLGRPLRWAIRTKYLFYALIASRLLGGPALLTEAAMLFSLVHGLYAAIGFFAVRTALRGASSGD